MFDSSMRGWLIAMARRRILATTLIYAALLTIRSASSAGEDARDLAALATPVRQTSSVTMTTLRIGDIRPNPTACIPHCVAAFTRPSKLSCPP
ncbi:hypothetical protein LPW26_14235 [Rhodopseudomonas sp. HC1]|uniref:hypothetical protein n=1 Tax=Rhodopseudomonas infernalis TaxID=2897386 RepID=UPI001EE8D5A5|nr:hypothetical protein [Rhodopseudomonas infernalis]MCG6205807.1 hypothetical protein [Rhodopseudomonas infernalis]